VQQFKLSSYKEEKAMQIQQVIDTLIKLDGAVYCVFVDSYDGKLLASTGGEGWPLTILAEKSAVLVRTDRQAMQVLDNQEEVAQELLFTMKDYFHAIMVLPKSPRFYVCTGLHRKQGNLALLRRISHDLIANWVVNT